VCIGVSRILKSSERQLAEPSASLAQRTGATGTSGEPAFGYTIGRTCNSLRISTEPSELNLPATYVPCLERFLIWVCEYFYDTLVYHRGWKAAHDSDEEAE